MAWPDWHPNAVQLTLPTGQSFTIPGNPTGMQDQQPTNISTRPSRDGWVTYSWPNPPGVYPHNGWTGKEGVAPWKAAQLAFRGQRCAYHNALTGVGTVVVVVRFDLQADGEHPATWQWFITCQDAQQFSRAPAGN